MLIKQLLSRHCTLVKCNKTRRDRKYLQDKNYQLNFKMRTATQRKHSPRKNPADKLFPFCSLGWAETSQMQKPCSRDTLPNHISRTGGNVVKVALWSLSKEFFHFTCQNWSAIHLLYTSRISSFAPSFQITTKGMQSVISSLDQVNKSTGRNDLQKGKCTRQLHASPADKRLELVPTCQSQYKRASFKNGQSGRK